MKKSLQELVRRTRGRDTGIASFNVSRSTHSQTLANGNQEANLGNSGAAKNASYLKQSEWRIAA